MIGWRDGGLAAAVAAHLAVMFGGLGAAAPEQLVRALPCGGDAIARGAAGRIVDGRTFALEDGREVRLAAIEVPPLAAPGEAREAEAAPGGVAAKDALAALLEGADIVLRRADVAADRYGRILAYTSTAREGIERSVQADLLGDLPASAAGSARANARRNSSPANGPRARPSLASGPFRIMTRSTPTTPPMCWPSVVALRWSKARWYRCVKAEPRSTSTSDDGGPRISLLRF
jgi:endonuclease YncB( thermonuclease family)